MNGVQDTTKETEFKNILNIKKYMNYLINAFEIITIKKLSEPKENTGNKIKS